MFTITLFKDARGIFTPFIMFNDSFIESVMKTIGLPCYMVLWHWQCTTFNQHFYHFDAVTTKTWHLFIHSHFVRILHHERASKINCGILDFSNAVAIYKAIARGLKKTKCPAVRTFSRISAKTLFLIVWKYSIFIENYQTIRKTRMASQLSGCGFLGIEQSRAVSTLRKLISWEAVLDSQARFHPN